MKNFVMRALTFTVIFFLHLAHGQPGAQAWVQRYHGSGDTSDVPLHLAVDTSGNVFVAGYSTDLLGLKDWVTVAYSSAGMILWTNRYNGPADHDDQPNAIAVDGDGNVFVSGVSLGTNTGQDFTTIKYSNNGVPLWTNRYNGFDAGGDGANAMAIDAAGNVVVTGISVGTNGFSSYFDFATIKYSGSGVPLWTNRYNGPASNEDGATDLALDANGNVFVTGTSFNLGGDVDFLTVGYSSAGVPLWTNRYDGPGNNSDYARAVVVDGSGNVFVTGDSWGGAAADYATIKYSPAGVPLWTNRYHGTWTGNNFATALAVDGSGNVFVTGSDGGFASTNGGYATIKYSNSGTALWTNHYNGPLTALGFNDNARAIAVDKIGNVFVTGQSFRDFVTTDLTTVAYSGDGVPLWTNQYNGPVNGDDTPRTKHSLALGPNGDVYVTGASDGNDSEEQVFDFVTIKYSALVSIPFLEIARSNAFAIISWPTNAVGFQLEESTNIALPNSWTPIEQTAATNSAQISVTIPASASQKFFRLKSQ